MKVGYAGHDEARDALVARIRRAVGRHRVAAPGGIDADPHARPHRVAKQGGLGKIGLGNHPVSAIASRWRAAMAMAR